MAKATVTTVPVVTEVREKRIVLELTEDEARTLHTLFQRVGGSPDYSPRKHIDTISDVLRDVGVEYLPEYRAGAAGGKVFATKENNPNQWTLDGSIYFLNDR
jgi:glutathionyl-hydroquinone reductase